MPDSSFFNPMQMGPSIGGFPPFGQPQTPKYVADPRFNLGYQNVYGTRLNADVSPVSRTASLDATVPIGDYQNQFFGKFGAYARPGMGTGAPSDWGVRLGFEKKFHHRALLAIMSSIKLFNKQLEILLIPGGL